MNVPVKGQDGTCQWGTRKSGFKNVLADEMLTVFPLAWGSRQGREAESRAGDLCAGSPENPGLNPDLFRGWWVGEVPGESVGGARAQKPGEAPVVSQSRLPGEGSLEHCRVGQGDPSSWPGALCRGVRGLSGMSA